MGWRAPGETQDLNQKPRLEEVLSLTLAVSPLHPVIPCSTTSNLQNPPESLQKPQVLTETQLRTRTTRVFP